MPTKTITRKNLPKPNGPYNTDQLNKSLMDVEDLLNRALCPFVLLGNTARDIVDGRELTGDRITIGIESKHLTKEAVSTLKTFLGLEMPKPLTDFSYQPVGLPKYKVMPRVYIKIINKAWAFLKNK